MNKHSGFTLVEISIVLVIIGLILGAVMYNSGMLIGNTKATSTVKLITDLSGAVADFKARYHYLPGDLPSASQDIQGITCDHGNGNGLIETNPDEVSCVVQHLVLAGFIKGSATGIVSPFGTSPDISVRSVNTSQVYIGNSNTSPFPPTVKNVIEISNIPFDAAQNIDNKIDDGNLGAGNVIAFPLPNTSGVAPANTTLDVAL